MKQFKMNERQRFSIRKFSIGAASVLLGSVFFVANPATEVQAAETSTEVIAQDRDVNPDNSSALSSSETSSQNPSVGQAETQGTEKKESGTPSKDGEGKAKATVENKGDEKVDGVVKPVSGESSPMSEVEKDKKEAQPELEEGTVSIGRRSKSPQSQDRSVEKQNEGSAASSTSYINGEGSYSLSDNIHKLLQRLKNSDENQEQVQKLNEAYEKFNAALGTSETGLVDQEIFNAALEEYRKASLLHQGETGDADGHTRERRATSDIQIGETSSVISNRNIDSKPVRNTTEITYPIQYGLVQSFIARSDNGISDITIEGTEGIKGLSIHKYFTANTQKTAAITLRSEDTSTSGIYILKITATEKGTGAKKSFVSTIYFPPSAPSFKTTSEELKGKANEKPIIKANNIKANTIHGISADTHWQVFLVRGGTSRERDGITRAEGYEILAQTDVREDGEAWFTPDKYKASITKIGTSELRLVLAMTKSDKSTIHKDLISPLSSGSIHATDPVDKSKLIEAKQALDELTKEADPTTGKTTDTASAYKTAKQDALNEIASATRVIGNQDATTEDVSRTLASVKEKNTQLTQAKNNLVEAATEEERNTLKTSAEALKKATTDNKTPKSVEAYNKKYDALKAELERVKEKAINVANKGANATKEEVRTSKGEVEEVQRKLNEAAGELVEQADKSKLIEAKQALDELTKEADPTTGKTTDTASAYKTAKQDALNEIASATRVIDDQNATSQAVSDEIEKLKSAMKKLQEAKDGLRDVQIPSHSTEKPTQPDQGATETPIAPSEPAPQPSQPTAPGQPASPTPVPSSAPTQAPRVAASPSASSTSTQAPAQEQVDKSELRALTQELDQRLKALATVSDPKIDAAKAILRDAQKALEDSALTEQGLRTAVESVKAALDSLKDVKANASDSKPAQDKKDAKQGTEDSKDSDKMTETNSVPAGVIVVGLLALLGVIAFWLVRRKKESEIQQLSTELTKVLGQLDAEKVDKKVLAKAQNLLQETLDFVKEENGSAETEAKLVEELKAILAKLK